MFTLIEALDGSTHRHVAEAVWGSATTVLPRNGMLRLSRALYGDFFQTRCRSDACSLTD